MLSPKIHRKSMLPPRWRMEPWRNIDAMTDHQMFLPGSMAGEMPSVSDGARHCPVFASRNDSGARCVISQGTAARS